MQKYKHVNYNVIEDTQEHICVEDIGPWDQYLSVTNGVEILVKDLSNRLNGRRLEYIDSDGRRDQIIYSGNKFIKFMPIQKS